MTPTNTKSANQSGVVEGHSPHCNSNLDDESDSVLSDFKECTCESGRNPLNNVGGSPRFFVDPKTAVLFENGKRIPDVAGLQRLVFKANFHEELLKACKAFVAEISGGSHRRVAMKMAEQAIKKAQGIHV